jgi:hypothetical protein
MIILKKLGLMQRVVALIKYQIEGTITTGITIW